MPQSSALPSIEEWRSKGRMLRILNKEIFVIDTGGEKEPLLVLHGFPTCSYDFWKVLPHLQQYYRVVVHDHPGFGFSDKPMEYSYSLIEQCDVACMVWECLGISSGHVLAHDYGTSIATELVAKTLLHQSHLAIRSLTLCNGSVHIELAKLRFIQKLLRHDQLGPLVAKLSTQATFNRNMRNIWYDRESIEQGELDNLWQLLEMNDGRSVLPKISKYTMERFTFWHRWVGALKQTKIPVNILWTQNDPIAVEAIAHTLHGEIPDSALKLLPGLGHYPMLEQPKRWLDGFFELMSRFNERAT